MGINRLWTNSRQASVIGDVIQNAVPINVLKNTAEGALGTYAMAAYAQDNNGREFVAIITVEKRGAAVSSIEVYDVAHSVSGRQRKGSQATTKVQEVIPIKATNISIKKLFAYCQGNLSKGFV